MGQRYVNETDFERICLNSIANQGQRTARQVRETAQAFASQPICRAGDAEITAREIGSHGAINVVARREQLGRTARATWSHGSMKANPAEPCDVNPCQGG